MKMRLKDGKAKVLTLSYDDGVVQDIRFVKILDRHGLKCTFNINSGLYTDESSEHGGDFGRMKLSEAKKLFEDSKHEIAVHAFTHPFLEKIDSTDVMYEILEDRKNIEKNYNIIARGMAYPYGTYSDSVINVLEQCHIAYARTVKSTHSFAFPENWLKLHPTCHHNDEKLDELIKKFIEQENQWGDAQMFYLWGHSYEFDNDNNWDLIEKFAEYTGGRDDIWYATNIEIYDYVKAYQSLNISIDKKIVCNNSAIDVWFELNNKIFCVKGGETLYL